MTLVRKLAFLSAYMDSDLLWSSLAMFTAALIGGAITLIRRWSDEWLHLFLSFGAGVFLGAVFGHLLPEVMNTPESHSVGLYILAGFLLIYFVERILLNQNRGEGDNDDPSHKVAAVTFLIGLSVHSVMEGVGLAAVLGNQGLGEVLLVSILAHKIPAAFSLASLMVLGKHSRSRVVLALLVFAATAPLGALVLGPLAIAWGEGALVPLTGIVTGSFLYVATADLLPEVFHSRERLWVSLALLILGVVVMSFIGTA